MNDLKKFLNKDEMLLHIQRYELSREEGRIFIDVKELISEIKHNKFFAVPTGLIREADEKFIGAGESLETALKDCLLKIKAYPIDVVLPAPSPDCGK